MVIMYTTMPTKQDEDHARSFEQSMKKSKVPLFVVPSPRVNEVLLHSWFDAVPNCFHLYFYIGKGDFKKN